MNIEEQSVNQSKTSIYNISSSSSSSLSTAIYDYSRKPQDMSSRDLAFSYEGLSSLYMNDLSSITGKAIQMPKETCNNFKFAVGDIYSLIFSQYYNTSQNTSSNIGVKQRRQIRFIKRRVQSRLNKL